MTELIRNGKYDEKGELKPVDRTILPFQVVETVMVPKVGQVPDFVDPVLRPGIFLGRSHHGFRSTDLRHPSSRQALGRARDRVAVHGGPVIGRTKKDKAK